MKIVYLYFIIFIIYVNYYKLMFIGKTRINKAENTRNNIFDESRDNNAGVKLLDENYIFKWIDSTQKYFDDLLVKPIQRKIDLKYILDISHLNLVNLIILVYLVFDLHWK